MDEVRARRPARYGPHLQRPAGACPSSAHAKLARDQLAGPDMAIRRLQSSEVARARRPRTWSTLPGPPATGCSSRHDGRGGTSAARRGGELRTARTCPDQDRTLIEKRADMRLVGHISHRHPKPERCGAPPRVFSGDFRARPWWRCARSRPRDDVEIEARGGSACRRTAYGVRRLARAVPPFAPRAPSRAVLVVVSHGRAATGGSLGLGVGSFRPG